MPVAIPALGALAAAGAATATIAAAFTIASTVLYGIVSKQQQHRQERKAYAASRRDLTLMIRSADSAQRWVYGRARVSGPIVFAHSVGEDNGTLYIVVVLTGHEVDEVEEILFNEKNLGVTHGQVLSGSTWFSSQLTPRNFGGRGSPPLIFLALNSSLRVTLPVSGVLSNVVWVRSAIAQTNGVTAFKAGQALAFHLSGTTVTVHAPGAYAGMQIWVAWNEGAPLVDVESYRGTSDQAADPVLIAQTSGRWTSAHRLLGRAYVRVALQFDLNKFRAGLPNIGARVRGRKVFDPRAPGDPDAWSDNPALCIRDYLRHGLRVKDVEIDDDSFIAAANICDELIEVDPNDDPARAEAWRVLLQEGVRNGTWESDAIDPDEAATYRQRRYTCNGAFTLDRTHESILSALLSSCAGMITVTGGLWRLVVGAYVTPTMTLTEDDLRGPITVIPTKPLRDSFNTVRGVYTSKANLDQATDYPPVSDATYVDQDGKERPTDLQFEFTDDGIAAQRLAKIHLEKQRHGVVVQMPCKMRAIALRPGDTVMLTIARFGWSSKVFRVEGWTLRFDEDLGIDLVLQEEAATNYEWSLGDATVLTPSPDLSIVQPLPDDGGSAEMLMEPEAVGDDWWTHA